MRAWIVQHPQFNGREARNLLVAGAVEDIICRVLCLGRSMNEKSAIVAKLLKPAGHVCGLILDDRGCNTGFRAKVGGSHFRAQFLF
jgi:hypothetical protein